MTSFTKDLRLLGLDLSLTYRTTSGTFEDGDLALTESTARATPGRRVDLAVANDVEAATQLLANRLKTQQGELADLGHPDYGSRHHELIGEPNVERTRSLIKLYVLEALRHEPRIAEILDCRVTAAHEPARNVVRIVLEVSLIDRSSPLNLVVPFNLEAVQ